MAVSSGSAALVCGLAALGLGPGDEVIIPAYTWIASAEAVIAVGAVPILAEIDQSLTLDAADVESKITGRTKAIMPVHMRGAPCQMHKIVELAQSRELKVLEDVAQAAGGTFCGSLLALEPVSHVPTRILKIAEQRLDSRNLQSETQPTCPKPREYRRFSDAGQVRGRDRTGWRLGPQIPCQQGN